MYVGPTVEFLNSPDERDAAYCVMIGTIPPGVSVPLHSHPDVESFFTLSGTVQVLFQRGDNSNGDVISAPYDSFSKMVLM
jgi:hypothetical protein